MLVAAVATAVAPAGAQTPEAAPQTPQAVPPTDYQVGPQDVLAITVFNEPELSGRFTIDSDGALTFPLIGRVAVEGQSLRQIQDTLTRLLGDGFLINPQVSVEIQDYRSQNVYVLGEVRSPGIYTLAGNMTLIEVLVQAGSTTQAAGNEVQIVRAKGERKVGGPVLPQDDADVEVTYVDLRDIQSGRLSEVSLRDGDTVFVPKASTFFITGEIRASGSYVWQRGLTIRQAIALGGGLTDRGSDNRIKIERQVGDRLVEIDASLTDVVQPGDTIRIGRRFF